MIDPTEIERLPAENDKLREENQAVWEMIRLVLNNDEEPGMKFVN